MSCRILKGAPVAAEIDKETAELTAKLSASGVMPTLAIVRVGERDSDLARWSGDAAHSASACGSPR